MNQDIPDNNDKNQLGRLLELLSDRTVQGLSAEQAQELQALLKKFPDLDEDALDLTAAAIELAFAMPQESLPRHVRDTIAQQTLTHFTSRPATHNVEPAAPAANTLTSPSPNSTTTANPNPDDAALADNDSIVAIPSKYRARLRKTDETTRLSWIIAGICLLLALSGWWPRLFSESVTEDKSPVQLREEFLNSAKDIIVMQWKVDGQADNQNISGDVVWSNDNQRGYLLLRNLIVNNPTEQQYQLWITDSTRDEKYPVNAGVFDVLAANSETVISFAPLLTVNQVEQFTITLEKAGGVVLSDTTPLLSAGNSDAD